MRAQLWLVLLAVGIFLWWLGWGYTWEYRHGLTDRTYRYSDTQVFVFGCSMFFGPILVVIAVLWRAALALRSRRISN